MAAQTGGESENQPEMWRERHKGSECVDVETVENTALAEDTGMSSLRKPGAVEGGSGRGNGEMKEVEKTSVNK